MTLVVAKVTEGVVAMAGDTLISQQDTPLSHRSGTIKMCLLPGNLCVGFSNSPELASKAFADYSLQYPDGTNFSNTIEFFEKSSQKTGNDYLIGFGDNPRAVKIANGKRIHSIAKTVWIGDKDAFEAFQGYSHQPRKHPLTGRAVTATLFASEVDGSPASDLYTTMRSVVQNRDIKTVGGFVAVASSRGPAFRFSAYTDMLFDWPLSHIEQDFIELSDKVNLTSTGENLDYSLSQFCSAYMGANFVCFYHLAGRLLFVFYGENNGLADRCAVVPNIYPTEIKQRLDASFGFDLKWRVWVGSAQTPTAPPQRERPTDGFGLTMMMHANTFPKEPEQDGILIAAPSTAPLRENEIQL